MLYTIESGEVVLDQLHYSLVPLNWFLAFPLHLSLQCNEFMIRFTALCGSPSLLLSMKAVLNRSSNNA